MIPLGIVLIIIGVVLWGYGFYIYPKVYRWTDCDHDTETIDWKFLKEVFALAPVITIFGVRCLVELHILVVLSLLLLSPISVGLLYLLKKA